MDTILQIRIFELLCKSGVKYSKRDLAKRLKVSPTAIGKAIPTLLKNKIITEEKIKNIHFITLNRSKKVIHLKRAQNLKELYDLNNYLEESLAGATIILFGSYSLGEDTAKSDIDIAVIGRKPKTLSLDKFEQKLLKPININFYMSLKDIDTHLRNNILGGIVLHGSIEL